MNANRDHFGPWTTTLHHANQLELSAFWKQRLHRLRSLPNLPTRLDARKMLAFCGIALAILLLPRVEIQPVAVADDGNLSAKDLEAAAASLDSADASTPFIATFSNGVQVELIGLSENPSKDKPWWRPDGSPLKDRPSVQAPAVFKASPGQVLREVCWRWINKPDDVDFETSWTTVPHYMAAGGGSASDSIVKNAPPLTGLVIWALGMPIRPDTCTFRFSVTVDSTPWKSIFSKQGVTEGNVSRSDFGVQYGAAFGPARRDGDFTEVAVSYQIPDQAVRLIAVDQQDNVHTADTSTGGGALGFNLMTYRFRGLPLEKIKRFELQAQTRRFETIEFRNVSLDPNKQTEVEIVHPKAASSQGTSAQSMPEIKPGDVVMIQLLGGLPDAPIADLFRVEPSGKVPLGPSYGRVAIAGLNYEEAEQAITRHLADILENPVVQVTDGQWELERRSLQ